MPASPNVAHNVTIRARTRNGFRPRLGTLTQSGRIFVALDPAADVARSLRGGVTEEMLAEMKAAARSAA